MHKFITASAIGVFVFAAAIAVEAQVSRDDAALSTPGINRTLVLPEAADNATVILLGESVDPASGKAVEGYAIFHHREGHNGGPPGSGGNNDGGTTSSCFAYLDKHTSWKTAEEYLVDPTNTEGLDSTFIRETIAGSINDWGDAADGSMDGVLGAHILGDEVSGVVDGADSESPDGKNEVLFGSISSDGAIAVTIVWGIFSGPPQQRELVEWDQVYDQVDFDWSDNGEAGKMDFHNIAAHELGHAVGMGHPDDTCTEETMYAYAAEGETNKRDLHTGDITGVDELY